MLRWFIWQQVNAYASLKRNAADCIGNFCIILDGAIKEDEEFGSNFNSVEGRNFEFIGKFMNVTAPNCLWHNLYNFSLNADDWKIYIENLKWLNTIYFDQWSSSIWP